MSHDRASLSALVDGELDHESRDEILAHLAHCDDCRAQVDAERRVKSLLSGMPDPAPSASLQAGLLALADSGRPGDLHTPAPSRGPLRSSRPGSPAGTRPPGQPGTRRPRRAAGLPGRSRRRLTVGVAGAAAMASMALVTAFAVGGGPPTRDEVSVVPPVERYAVEHAGTASEVPLSDPGAVTASFGRELLELPAGR
ncbi:zf-HC2 domain-containing protein [Actinopolymorpha pittospori]|uniref:Anti-sigma factor RsiW n=1 Tax=Actinopolymorpha pittospori TaxID=648752 RepID=A0A927NA65_9ACTN|nr:anti-sigma factor RsiW [Actinopolymorpha pittospori]